MIHVATLLHDDVIDGSALRRNLPTLNALFGPKLAVLAGDFLLARASQQLSSLESLQTVALMSQSLENLVAGELLQLKAPGTPTDLDVYIDKSFYKTASLMANSCQAAAVLGSHPREV